MMGGITKSTFGGLLLVLEVWTWLTRTFLLWKRHVLFLVFMFCKFSIVMVLLLNCVVSFVLLSNLGVWCVMLILIHCVVFILKEKDNGELAIGDGKKDNDEFNKNDVVLNKVDFSRSKLSFMCFFFIMLL